MALTVTLTEAQKELVARKTKPISERPVIFRPGVGDVVIDDDFEAFLICASTGARTSMSLTLNVLLQFTVSPTTRQAVYREMLTDSVADAKTRQMQAKQILGAFDAGFQGLDPGPFRVVPSVQNMLDDLRTPLAGLNSYQDFANYQFALSFIYLQNSTTTSDADMQQMIRSYYTALVAYM